MSADGWYADAERLMREEIPPDCLVFPASACRWSQRLSAPSNQENAGGVGGFEAAPAPLLAAAFKDWLAVTPMAARLLVELWRAPAGRSAFGLAEAAGCEVEAVKVHIHHLRAATSHESISCTGVDRRRYRLGRGGKDSRRTFQGIYVLTQEGRRECREAIRAALKGLEGELGC